jgi:hypothetical protein
MALRMTLRPRRGHVTVVSQPRDGHTAFSSHRNDSPGGTQTLLSTATPTRVSPTGSPPHRHGSQNDDAATPRLSSPITTLPTRHHATDALEDTQDCLLDGATTAVTQLSQTIATVLTQHHSGYIFDNADTYLPGTESPPR